MWLVRQISLSVFQEFQKTLGFSCFFTKFVLLDPLFSANRFKVSTDILYSSYTQLTDALSSLKIGEVSKKT